MIDSFLALLAKALFAVFALAAIATVLFLLAVIGLNLIWMLDAWLRASST